MVDLREKVAEDRGMIAKIQSVIPGFSGYRAREDIRAADNMLRMQLADRLAGARAGVEACRAVLADNLSLDHMDRIGVLINKFRALEGEVRHAEQGYSGIAAKIQVGEAELNRLYEFDYAQIAAILAVENEIPALRAAVDADDGAAIKNAASKILAQLTVFGEAFKKRMTVITGTEA